MLRTARQSHHALGLSIVMFCGFLVWSAPAEALTKYLMVRITTAGNSTKGDPADSCTLSLYYGFKSAATRECAVSVDIKLPDNATIKVLRARGHDSHYKTITAVLHKAVFNSESVTDLATAVSSNATDVWSSSVISGAVDNFSYYYWVSVSVPGNAGGEDLRVWMVEVQYEVP